MESSDKEFDVFVSFEWDTDASVSQFCKKMNENSYKIWRNQTKIEDNNLGMSGELASAIKKSKIFLCCITKKYSESKSCIREFSYSNSIGKPIIILFIEDLKLDDLGGIGFIISDLYRIDCFKNPNSWWDNEYEIIKKNIDSCLDTCRREFIQEIRLINGRYKKIKKLGEGGFSIVYLIEDNENEASNDVTIDSSLANKDFQHSKIRKAMKEFKPIESTNETLLTLVEEEISNMKKMVNEKNNIVKFIDSFKDKVILPNREYHFINYYIITEYYEDGTLNDEIAQMRVIGQKIEDYDLISWTTQLISAIAYLHEMNIIHRDIKPANIFLSKRRLILGDLGLAKHLTDNSTGSRFKIYGTIPYIAPEIVIASRTQNEKIDIWSLGCVLYDMIMLERLFPRGLNKDIIHNFDIHKVVSELRSENQIIKSIVKRCLSIDPENRPSAKRLNDTIRSMNLKILKENSSLNINKSTRKDDAKTELSSDTYFSKSNPSQLTVIPNQSITLIPNSSHSNRDIPKSIMEKTNSLIFSLPITQKDEKEISLNENLNIDSYTTIIDSSKFEIKNDFEFKWKKGNFLGKGACGKVYQALLSTGEIIAVKQIEMDEYDSNEITKEYNSVKEEIKILSKLEHKNIVKYKGTNLVGDVVNIFTELLSGGTIEALLKTFGPLEEDLIKIFTLQIVDAVFYLHSLKIAHRDIKGKNVMLVNNGVIKLIDFGCAKRLKNNRNSETKLQNSFVGTPHWSAPEVITQTGHGIKADIWSIGATVFEMAVGQPPWGELSKIAVIIKVGDPDTQLPELPENFSDQAKNFVKMCMTRNFVKRPSAADLLKNEFLTFDNN